MNQWAANRSLKERGGVQADVHVLTSSHWPSYPAMDSIILPPLLKGCTDSFEDFYFSKFGSNRKLFWQHSLEHVTLKAYFPHGRKELEVSLFQALVLLLYNNKSAMKEKDRYVQLFLLQLYCYGPFFHALLFYFLFVDVADSTLVPLKTTPEWKQQN